LAENDKELKKLIEAAEKSVQESKQSRFDSKPEADEKPAANAPDDYTRSEWEQWGAQQITGQGSKKPGSWAVTFLIIGIILALSVFIIFHFNIYKQEQDAANSQTGTLLKKMNHTAPAMEPGSGASGFSSGSGVITHKGVPSAQKPPDYKQPRQRSRQTGTPAKADTPRWMKENPPPPSTPAPGEDPIFLQ
jgi:hypothetical protein